jgi:hypothetical protein
MFSSVFGDILKRSGTAEVQFRFETFVLTGVAVAT